MRTITTTVYKFEELSKESQAAAIEQERNKLYKYNDFGRWATDDDYLLEPKHNDLIKLFPDYKDLIVENTREKIYFDTDRNRFLDIENAIDIKDSEKFLIYLGIPKEMQDNVYYKVFTPAGKNNSTQIEFTENDQDKEFTPEEIKILVNAEEKFNDYISEILEQIESSIEYNFTDEAIKESIEANDYEFTEGGELI